MTTYPKELTEREQWVCVGTDKVPMQALRPKAASASDPTTWTTYEYAQKSVDVGNYQYVGYVFTEADGLVGIDIDCGYKDGELSLESLDILGVCESYTEKSKSGRGFHIFLKGDLPFKGRNNHKGLEIYKSNRYFVMTGNTYLDLPIIRNQHAIDYIVAKYFPEVRETQNKRSFRVYEPIWSWSTGTIKIEPEYPEIEQGSRNLSLLSLGGQLWSSGCTKEYIYHELLKVNKLACKPELDINEVQSIVNSVTRYKR